MSDRRLEVSFAPGFTPFSASPTWVDLSSRLRSASWIVGRDDELEHFSPGTAEVILRNRDRFLDADYTAGPWFGQLDPYVPVRIRSQNLTTLAFEDEFYGFVVNGFQQELAPKGAGDCRLELVDLLGVLGGYKLPDMFIYALQQVSTLVGIWDLTKEPNVDESVPDSSGNGHEGTVIGGVKFGEPPTQPGHGNSALFECVSTAFPDREQSFIHLGRSQLLASSFSTSTVVATFKRRSAATANFGILFAHGNGNNSLSGVCLKVLPNGNIQYVYLTNGAGVNFEHEGSVGADFHCVIATGAGIALDTATLDASSTSGGGAKVNGAFIGGGRGALLADHWDGWIGVVAIYDGNMGTTDREDVMDACEKLVGVTSDVQIAWALDRLGVPAGKRNLDVGTVYMGPAETVDRDALEWIREVTATEGGGLYVDHRDGGKIRFVNRYSRHLATRSVTSQATFSDDPGSNKSVAIHYMPEGLDVAPNGLDGIVNQVSVTWRDGTVTVEDAASVAAYGPRGRQLDTQATTAAQAESAGEWILANYAQPRSRVRGAVASKGTFADRHDEVQDLRIGDRVTFRLHPQKVGTATTSTLFIDGASNVCQGPEWRTSFRYAPGYTFTPWIWGTSAWNTTAFWG
jgi:hypothetical protein